MVQTHSVTPLCQVPPSYSFTGPSPGWVGGLRLGGAGVVARLELLTRPLHTLGDLLFPGLMSVPSGRVCRQLAASASALVSNTC